MGIAKRLKMFVIAGALSCSAPAWPASLNVEDDFNRTVALSVPAKRIVSLAPHITENLFSAGAGDKIVGLVGHTKYPEAASHIPSIGDHSKFNLETILSLKPDLIVAWRTASNRESLDKIEKIGIPVYYSEPRNFADIVENILDFATLAGTVQAVDPEAYSVLDKLESIYLRYKDHSRLNVFYQIWSAPLMTLNGDHIISRVLDLCGVDNLFADLSIIAPQVSIEAVIKANPDVIIRGKVNGEPPDMSFWNKWLDVKAVQNQQYLFVDSDQMHRHTLRMLNGVEPLCRSIHKYRK